MRVRSLAGLAVALLLAILACASSPAPAPRGGEPAHVASIEGRVVDETGAPVSGARITAARESMVLRAESGEAGAFELRGMEPGAYDLRVEKAGFYVLVNHEFKPGAGQVDLVLNHRQEFEEKVEVQYAPPAIDTQKTATGTSIDATDLLDLPYSSSHDFRNGLALQPGVLRDQFGTLHINGGSANQVLYTLDGFNLTNPYSGAFDNRIPVDGIREINIDSTRWSAESGKSSAGTMAVQSATGDDSFRYGLTNFIPTGSIGGAGLASNWTPRGMFSGPWKKGRAWFFDAADAQYDRNQVDELPAGANRSSRWIANDLLRNQLLVGKSTLLSSTVLLNYMTEDHYGLGAHSPLETTVGYNQRNYLASLRAQHFAANGIVYELGFAGSRMNTWYDPRGTAIYTVRPDGTSGNYFQASNLASHRWQTDAAVVIPLRSWHGRHEWKIGSEADWIGFRRELSSHAFEVFRSDGTLWRRTEMTGPARFADSGVEQAVYAQDHWQFSKRAVLDVGVREDWNGAVGAVAFSPRAAVAFDLFGAGNTKLTAGWGLYHDTASLQTLTQDRYLDRRNSFYATDGTTLAATELLDWVVPARGLRLPRTFNTSFGIEQKLPAGFYLRANYIHRRTAEEFAFLAPPVHGTYVLGNGRHDRYDALEIRGEHRLRKGYTWTASYTRSVARSDAAVNLPITDPLFGIQGRGPLDWDAPNRALSSAWIPIGAKYGLAYVADWRTGFPFSVFSERTDSMVGTPNSYRYPNYFSLNLQVERIFRFRHYRWGFRVGFVNITNHKNPNVVNNVFESPNFMIFQGGQRRAFVTRIRLIGKD